MWVKTESGLLIPGNEDMVIVSKPKSKSAHWFKDAKMKNKIRVVGVMLTIVFVMLAGVGHTIKQAIINYEINKYKNYKIQPIINGTELYGFYTYTMDTIVKKESISYEFKPKDIFPVDASYLITEMDTTTLDSILHFYKKYEGVDEYVISCVKSNLITTDTIRATAISRWKSIPLYSSYDENHIDKEEIIKIRKIKKKKAIKSAPVSAGVVNNKTVSLEQIIPKDAKDRDKMIEFLAEGRNLYNYTYYANKHGYSPGVIIVFGALESAYGTSGLTNATKNKGNIKCFKNHDHAAHGCVKAYDKIEQGWDYYESFSSSWEGIRKKLNLVRGYKVVKKLPNNPTAYELIEAIHKSPYATDKDQNKKLKDLYNRFNMKALDDYIKSGYNITSTSGVYVFLDQNDLPWYKRTRWWRTWSVPLGNSKECPTKYWLYSRMSGPTINNTKSAVDFMWEFSQWTIFCQISLWRISKQFIVKGFWSISAACKTGILYGMETGIWFDPRSDSHQTSFIMKKFLFFFALSLFLSSCTDLTDMFNKFVQPDIQTPVEAPITPLDSMLILWNNYEIVNVGNMNMMAEADINQLGIALVDGPHISVPGVPHYRFQIVHNDKDTAYIYDYTVVVEYMVGSDRRFIEKPVNGTGSFSLYANTLGNARIHCSANALRKGTYMPSLAASRKSKRFYYITLNENLQLRTYN